MGNNQTELLFNTLTQFNIYMLAPIGVNILLSALTAECLYINVFLICVVLKVIMHCFETLTVSAYSTNFNGSIRAYMF